jgi:A/G-specific adenine glycosylase
VTLGEAAPVTGIAAPLLRWYDGAQRDLPWRRTRDPYAIWVAEIMLQQTRVATVVPYYERWMARFPTVESLAAAAPQEALALWQGLGFYRRCRLLHEGARWVLEHGLPGSAEGWLRVPGVGPYTAAAIASIAQGARAAVVDVNVERVFARMTASPATGAARRRLALEWASRLMPSGRAGDFAQALMDLGATVCTARSPECGSCPLAGMCIARQTWTVEQYPLANPKPSVIRLRRIAWLPYHDGAFGLAQTGEGEWWPHLWAFPQADADLPGAEESLLRIVGPCWLQSLGRLTHAITRHRIAVDASVCRCEARAAGLRWVDRRELGGVPLPSPHRRLLGRALTVLGLDG